MSVFVLQVVGIWNLDIPCNGTGVEVPKPDHQLILLRATRGAACEHIIRDVSHQVLPYVAPLPRRIDGLDLRKRHILSLNNDIRVRLDAVLATGPRPCGVPAKYRAADFVERRALAARCRGALAPEVVVKSVRAGLDQIPI